MKTRKLQPNNLEARFADIIWENEPIKSGALSDIALERLNWKKTTAFTVLKRLCEKGYFKNDHGTVTSLVSREEFYSESCADFVDKAYNGSLPAFVAAFAGRRKISDADLEELRRMIDDYEKNAK